MDHNQIIASLDEEISRLERVRELLNNSNGHNLTAAKSTAKLATQTKLGRKKRVLSEEARNRIAQAQKRRWAKQRKEASTAKKV